MNRSGAQVYAMTLPYWSDLFLTLVKGEYEGDTFMPKFESDFDSGTIIEEHQEFRIIHFRRKFL